jgi:formate--tetrahydrofolate ligase
VVLVATIRALKYHGGVAVAELNRENLAALEAGCVNLEKHLSNIQDHYGLPCVVAINHFTADTEAEVELLRKRVAALGAKVVVAKHWADGGAGALELADAVVGLIDANQGSHRYVYESGDSLWDKINAVATKVYGASGISAPTKVRDQIKDLGTRYPDFPATRLRSAKCESRPAPVLSSPSPAT